MMKRITLLIISLFALQWAQSQPCEKTEDLVKLPGVLKPDIVPGFTKNSTFKPTEAAAVMKTVESIAQLVKKDFSLQGGEAHYWYSANSREHIDVVDYPDYQVNVGFYQDVCVNGKRTYSSEFTVDYVIRANPSMVHFDTHPGLGFYADRTKYGYMPITIFEYLSYPKSWGDKIASGQGMIEDHDGNKWLKHKDAYFIWYITKGDMPLILPVSRKEFLQSVLECYDREKAYVTLRLKGKVEEHTKYMAQHEKSGNKVMYQYNLEDRQKAEKGLAELDSLIGIKRAEVEKVLKTQSAEWLAAPATHKFHDMRYREDQVMESMRFKGFYEGPDANTIYRFNPALAASKKGRTGEPLFFRVRHRYKVGETFSQQINDGFVKNFDLEGLRKLL